ncbi:hypothetical protein LX36DRAFT_307061 [Colletotrichum falcatum]|nr:hypothetical protein LX36DRAFT_307061 [Colletotrichum falcatum]
MSTLFVSMPPPRKELWPVRPGNPTTIRLNGTICCREHLSGFLKTRDIHVTKNLVKQANSFG